MMDYTKLAAMGESSRFRISSIMAEVVTKQKKRYLNPAKEAETSAFYKFVVLSNGKNIERFSVHRLVAQAFLENPNGFDEINHKDKNTENNRVENLEWCDHAYNVNYSKAKKVLQFDFDGTLLATYSSIVVAA